MTATTEKNSTDLKQLVEMVDDLPPNDREVIKNATAKIFAAAKEAGAYAEAVIVMVYLSILVVDKRG